MTFAVLAATAPSAGAEDHITTPREALGFSIGDDYHLANYSQLEAYWRVLEQESPRMRLAAMGQTAEGRTQWMAIVTAPENFERLEEYRDNARRLALAEDLGEEEARALARDTKTIVWIDGGLHANEVVGAHQLMQTVYEMVSRTDGETLRFLRDSVILFAHANPDGMELVSNWYMREKDPEERSTDHIPRLYQKYVGHDNNRDSYMVNQPETENISRVMYREWFPQIMYNHHQVGPSDIIIFIPPFRDPPNYNYDPLLVLGNQALGLAMHSRLVAEGKPGSAARDYSSYSTWFNGNIRTVGYFHNQIGILTEIKGHPTPMELAFWPDRQLPSNDFVMPHVPGTWHFRDAIGYSVTLNRAVLDYASRNRETILFNRWRMGRNNIERGSRDHWTITPRKIYEVEDAVREAGVEEELELLKPTFRRRGDGLSKDYLPLFRPPEERDARGYIIPADQADFPTAVKFVNTLVKNGVTIHRASADFEVAGKAYPAGSLVVKAAQAFRPHVMDMFEPQDHPDEFLYEGGPPVPPYDNAGYTLAFQMGVEFDRVTEGFEGPFERIEGFATPPAGALVNGDGAAGFLFSHAVNDSVVAINRLMASGHRVYWLTEAVAGDETWPQGTIYVEAQAGTAAELAGLATELGLSFTGVSQTPASGALKLNPVRIGLWDRYGGSMPSGWTRWLLEQFEFPYARVYPPELDDGSLKEKFDILVFPTGALDMDPPRRFRRPEDEEGPDPKKTPREYRAHIGDVTEEATFPELRAYLEAGGPVIAIGSSTKFAAYLDLPMGNHIVDGEGEPLKPAEFFVPSSLLEVRVNNRLPIAYGLPERLTVMSDRSPVMRLKPDADKAGVTQIAWFDSDRPLKSGWAWGQDRLFGGTAMAEAKVGEGRLYLFGPEILYRGQSHGSFPLFFNAIYLAAATPVRLGGAAPDMAGE